jgi:alpha/beta superfamily hydrolase
MLRDVLLPAFLPNSTAEPRTVTLLLAGYSYGSLAASACSPPSDTADVHFETSYVLISYPLSVAWALCALQTSFFTSALRIRSKDHCVLAVYGDQDQFTAVEKFRRWAAELGRSESSRSVEVAGADHFWRDKKHKADLLSAICNWIS